MYTHGFLLVINSNHDPQTRTVNELLTVFEMDHFLMPIVTPNLDIGQI
jgi:hypothetical protein